MLAQLIKYGHRNPAMSVAKHLAIGSSGGKERGRTEEFRLVDIHMLFAVGRCQAVAKYLSSCN
jgi:hypothetical protein